MMTQKPFAPAADRNKQVILDALQSELSDAKTVFEFGSGTGQHICHFAKSLPHITWQPSELHDKIPGLQQWITESGCTNINPPITLDLTHQSTPAIAGASACYSANTLHIVSWPSVIQLFKRSAHMLSANGKLCVYGPFMFNGKHISDSNQAFDHALRHADANSGIRDLDDLNALAAANGFAAARVKALPANNHLLVWDQHNEQQTGD